AGLACRSGVGIDDDDTWVVGVDGGHLVVDLVDRLRVLVAEAEVYGEGGIDFPVVLDEEGIAPLTHADRTGDTALALEAGAVEQHVSGRVASAVLLFGRRRRAYTLEAGDDVTTIRTG